jgi:biopolymer transport protein TolR
MGASLKQAGGGGGRRGRSRGRRHAPMSEINVTPFVDVMLVLLIIFMVAAPLMTAGVPLDLPQASGRPLDSQNRQPIIVSVTPDGKVFIGQEDKEPIALKDLADKLRAIAKDRGGSDEPIFVRGDKATQYGAVAQVMARIKEAGFKKLSLVTQVDGGG